MSAAAGIREDRKLAKDMRWLAPKLELPILTEGADRLEARLDAAEALQAELGMAKEALRDISWLHHDDDSYQALFGKAQSTASAVLARLSAADVPREPPVT